jgi:FkbM family methyltransferase
MSELMLQDDHTAEVLKFFHDIRGYILPEHVRTILDIGSRDARESITLKGLFPNAIIYAFECNPQAIQLCKKNISDRRDIVLIEKAVSDVNGPIEFYAIDPHKTMTVHADGNIGASSLFLANPEYPYEQYSQKRIIVESTTLKEWAQNTSINDIDILWIDLQGAELRAFHGMKELLEKVRIIYTEVEFKQMYLGQPLFAQIDRFLRDKGFRILKITSNDWFGNALYVHKGFIENRFRRGHLLLMDKLRHLTILRRKVIRSFIVAFCRNHYGR